MNINATLFGQMITFTLFVWFTKQYVWSFLQKALQERQQKIADGLGAAERRHRDLALAQEAATKKMKAAKEEAAALLDEARRHGNQIIENAKQDALLEVERMKQKAHADVEQMVAQAQESLRVMAAKMAISGAEKILGKHLDAAANQASIDQLVNEI